MIPSKIGPGAVDALGQQIVAPVDQVVEHHQAQVAAAQLVDVGKGQRDLRLDRGVGPNSW